MATPSKAEYRFATVDDYPALDTACAAFYEYARKYEWVFDINLAKAVGSLKETIYQGKALVIDGYLVCVDTIRPWYSDTSIVQEWFVINLYHSGNIASIPKGLELFATSVGADLVMSADSSPVKIVAGAYEAAAFKPLTTSFYKVTTNGIRKASGI